MQRCSKLCARVDGPSTIIKKIGENDYKLELLDDYNILPTFNVKDLRHHHGEDLRASLFSQLWGIDAGASTTNIGNSINAYKLELPDDNNILPTFNVKDLRPYHDEDLRASLFSQLWGIDTGASITYCDTPNRGGLFFPQVTFNKHIIASFTHIHVSLNY